MGVLLLAAPGLMRLLAVVTAARIPLTAISMTLTFRVVNGFGLGYGAAGAAVAAFTVGTAAGSPWLGVLVDRRGLRAVLGLTTVAQGVAWAVAAWPARRCDDSRHCRCCSACSGW